MKYPALIVSDTNQGWPTNLLDQAIADRECPVIMRRHWSTDVAALDEPEAEFYADLGHEQYALLADEGSVTMLNLDHGTLYIHVGAADRGAAAEILAETEQRYPRSTPTEGTVPVRFWSYSHTNGPTCMSRQIAVQPWDRVAANYPTETLGPLAGMMSGFRPAHGGQLVLWQGVPGTGKTHALRALAWEWRDWADLHYVIDPDEMFGAHADYLVQVLLSGGDSGDTVLLTVGKDSPDEVGGRWQVIVLEDTGEMLAADAKQRVGQALSRLLNTVDGLIGQGLRVLVLVTTNEELKTLHPAIQRPGRCAARIEFGRFSRAEAIGWLEGRGLDLDEVPSDATLAELYAVAEDFAGRAERRTVGFAAA